MKPIIICLLPFMLLSCENKKSITDNPDDNIIIEGQSNAAGNAGDDSKADDTIAIEDQPNEMKLVKIQSKDTLKKEEVNIFDKNNNLTISLWDEIGKIMPYYTTVMKDGNRRGGGGTAMKEIISDDISFFISNYPPVDNGNIDYNNSIWQIEIYGNNIYTDRGISIGDEKALVIEKYGQPNFILENYTTNGRMPLIDNYNIKEAYNYNNGEYEVIELSIYFDIDGKVVLINLSDGT
jgi:hypothetical protein